MLAVRCRFGAIVRLKGAPEVEIGDEAGYVEEVRADEIEERYADPPVGEEVLAGDALEG